MTRPARRWHLFCRVVDNFGDAGILWRIARMLANEHDARVTLFVDEMATLARLVPGARHDAVIERVRIARYGAAGAADDADHDGAPDGPPDVVLTGLQAEPPAAYRAGMAGNRTAWIAYEYLSAEAWVETCHGSASPKADGCIAHFFFPGFGAATGGLPREHGLLAERDAFRAEAGAADAFLRALGVPVDRPDEIRCSFYGYPGAPLARLLDPTPPGCRPLHLIVPAVDVAAARDRWSRPGGPASDGARVTVVPFLRQADYDRLLWACAFNFVRGEDSWIRAIWAARPFVWQPYPQADGAHRAKRDAFLARVGHDLRGSGADRTIDDLMALNRRWNDAADAGAGDPDAATAAAPGPGATASPVADIARLADGAATLEPALRAWAQRLSTHEAVAGLVAFASRILAEKI